MIKKEVLVITFKTTLEAIKMEKYCMDNKLPGRIIPLPTKISAGCGIAWKTDSINQELFINELKRANISWEFMHIIFI